jgi:hypothetical protein
MRSCQCRFAQVLATPAGSVYSHSIMKPRMIMAIFIGGAVGARES